MMKDTIKVAVTGFVNGHCYWIYRGMPNEPELEVVAASFAPRQRIIYEDRMGREAFEGVDIYYDMKQMLDAHPEIQVCVCGGSNADHMEEFRLCAERGIHVVSMKVPTYDSAEYDEMIRLADEHHILVYIELEMRWRATVERIRELIAAGKLGEIRAFNAYNYSHNPVWWNEWVDIPEQSYGKRIPLRPGSRYFRGGALTDHPHIFDLTRYLFGSDFDTVYAEVAPQMRKGTETENFAYVIGRLKNGVIFSLDPSFANREQERPRLHGLDLSRYPRPVQVELEVVGSKGVLYADSYGADYVECMTPDALKYEVEAYDLALDDQRRIFLRGMIRDIREGTNTPDVDFRDHRKTLAAINAAYDSIYAGKPVKVEG